MILVKAMKKTYYKLVRDRIPEIIASQGKTCRTQTLDDHAYQQMLEEKLQEELNEYLESKDLEELADLLEVIHAVIDAKGYSWEQLETLRLEKHKQRGGFEKRLLLTEVLE